MKRYTAQEMLDAAETCQDPDISYMLRQAADMMERMRHEYKLKKKRQKGVATQIIVRRQVGEWEEVSE